MNVLMCCDSNVERAGVCLFILQWVRGIREAYHTGTITIYFRKSVLNTELIEEFRNLKADVITGDLPENETSASHRNRKKVRQDIRSILAKEHYDVIHVNSSAAGFSCIVLSEAYKHRVPVRISHSHGRNSVSAIKRMYLAFLKKALKRYATRYAACSLDAGLYMFGSSGINSRKWIFVPNTIDVNRFAFNEQLRDARRKLLGVDDDDLVIGATGQLIPLKNHTFLIDVVNELIKRDIKAKLVIFGEGDQRSLLMEKIKKLDLKNDVFLMGISDEIPQWLSAMDIYAMPSFSEGLPLGAIEAQANGLYCLLSNCVPKDVDLTKDVYHLPIGEHVSEWVDIITGFPRKTNEQRKMGGIEVAKAGFDSSKTSDYVRKLYER